VASRTTQPSNWLSPVPLLLIPLPLVPLPLEDEPEFMPLEPEPLVPVVL